MPVIVRDEVDPIDLSAQQAIVNELSEEKLPRARFGKFFIEAVLQPVKCTPGFEHIGGGNASAAHSQQAHLGGSCCGESLGDTLIKCELAGAAANCCSL